MKKYVLIGLRAIVVGYIGLRIWTTYYIEKHRPLSYEEARTNFTKVFNKDRIKRGLPIIAETWNNANPLHYKIQVWENPDTIPPRYAEKTVGAGLKAQIEFEEDRYELKKTDKVSYQVVIEYNFIDSALVCSLRNTREPDSNGTRWSGDIVATLTIQQANDSLQAYGLARDGLKNVR